MQKNEQSSRQIVMCHLMAIMRIDIEKKQRGLLLKWKSLA